MNTILLRPTDVLFFRDGRPMEGSLAGHGAAWPLPSVTNAALHAALHRAEMSGVHQHRRGLRGEYAADARRDRKFGSLVTAGPFPVNDDGRWFFPTPADLGNATLEPTLLPIARDARPSSSLPKPAQYAVGNRLPPSKESSVKPWLCTSAYERYLAGGGGEIHDEETISDRDIFDTEQSIGIAIDSETGTTGRDNAKTGTTGRDNAKGKIYSAHYLRLRETWRLGVLGAAWDKVNGDSHEKRELLTELFSSDRHIVVGGQQRVCTASVSAGIPPALPRGLQSGFRQQNGKFLVKWILLSPAVWPEIPKKSKDNRDMTPHPGGWLPNWVHSEDGAVLLRLRSGRIRRDYSGQKARRQAEKEETIQAKLVAALVPKPIVITGWALPDPDVGSEGGARSTHLAVPAGAVYYFEAETVEDASRLAAVLNWHGSDAPSAIKNRRSTLMGEKGFGLGVCGTWSFFPDIPRHPAQ